MLKNSESVCRFKTPTKCKWRALALSKSNASNFGAWHGQSGISTFALVRKKMKKNALCLNQSAFSNFALYVIKKFYQWKHVLSSCIEQTQCRESPKIQNKLSPFRELNLEPWPAVQYWTLSIKNSKRVIQIKDDKPNYYVIALCFAFLSQRIF